MQIAKSFTIELDKTWQKLEVSVDDNDLCNILNEMGLDGTVITPVMSPSVKFVVMTAEVDKIIAYWKREIKAISDYELADAVVESANQKNLILEKYTA